MFMLGEKLPTLLWCLTSGSSPLTKISKPQHTGNQWGCVDIRDLCRSLMGILGRWWRWSSSPVREITEGYRCCAGGSVILWYINKANSNSSVWVKGTVGTSAAGNRSWFLCGGVWCPCSCSPPHWCSCVLVLRCSCWKALGRAKACWLP